MYDSTETRAWGLDKIENEKIRLKTVAHVYHRKQEPLTRHQLRYDKMPPAARTQTGGPTLIVGMILIAGCFCVCICS